jgi:transposase
MDKEAKQPARRRRSKQERRRIVEESFEPGVSVARLARAHEVTAGQIYRWRELYRQGMLADDADPPAAEWLPVRLADGPATGGSIEIELARGRVRIEGAADAGALRLVLEVLGA